MIARRIPTILPQMSREESLEVTKIYSVCGLLKEGSGLVQERPFRSPHHTISVSAMVGGGRNPMPGEITLGCHGCLFIDEISELPKCHCSTSDISRYLKKLSMPFIDRMDLCVEAPRVAFEELTGNTGGETSLKIREEVLCAHQIQAERYLGTSYRFNADVKGSHAEEYFRVGGAQKRLLEDAFESLNLTARSYHKILKVARTIADLDEEEQISEIHISEAIGYRMIDEKYWGKE